MIFSYDITRRSTFDNIGSFWRKELAKRLSAPVPSLLVGCKNDLLATCERAVPLEEVEAMSKKWDLISFECSAFTGDRVEVARATL